MSVLINKTKKEIPMKMKPLIWVVMATILLIVMPISQAEPSNTPACQTDTITINGGTPDAAAKAYCQGKGNDWYTYTSNSSTSLNVTCCSALPTSGTTVPTDVIRLIEAAQTNITFNNQLRAATNDAQLEAIAKSNGYNVSAQDITAAMQSQVYTSQKTIVSTKSLSAAACGGFLQPPCNVCTKSVTVYFPFNFCCIPEYTECTEYQSQCSSGYYGTSPGICWPSDWTFTSIGQWAINFDQQWKLPMDWTKLNWVTELNSRMDKTPVDGLYIFVYRTSDNKLLIRRSDRPDDKGIFSNGNTTYSYAGNPAGNNESPHMFVRHTQLNGGWTPVWSAGQLEIYQGKIIWVSNESGHYAPPFTSLNYVTKTLETWNLVTPGSVKQFPYDWHKTWVNVPNSGSVIGVTVMQNGTVLGIGKDNYLYTRATLGSPWVQVPGSGLVIGVTVMKDGTILGIGKDNYLYTRATLSSPWVQVPNSGSVISVTVMKDGTILGIGTNNILYTRATLSSSWSYVPNSGSVIGVTVMQNGTILGIGTDNNLYTRATLSSSWVNIPNSGSVIGIATMLDGTTLGIGMGNDLWVRQKLQ